MLKLMDEVLHNSPVVTSVLIISLTHLVDGGRQFVCNTNSNLIEEKLQALLFNFFFKTEICCPLTNSYLVLI